MKLTISQFKGIAPKIDPRLLPDEVGQYAADVNLNSGSLVPLARDIQVSLVPEDTTSVYLYRGVNGNKWYYWNKNTRVIKDFIYKDDYNRIMVVQEGADNILVTDDTMLQDAEYRTIDETNSYHLGIPRLSNFKMDCSGLAGATNVESRSYFVSLARVWSDGKIDLGGLSDPAISLIGSSSLDVPWDETLLQHEAVTLSDIQVDPQVIEDTGVSQLYLYRVATGSSSAQIAYVTTIDLKDYTSTSDDGKYVYSYIDRIKTENLGESASSLEWDAPVEGLKDVVAMSNGILAGHKAQQIYFSYPYQPYAFPATYSVAVDSEIVGMGSFGNNLVVCTKNNPILITVQDPASPYVTPIQEPIPCLNKNTIVSTANGVLYASPAGIAMITPSSYEIVTKDIVSSKYFNTVSMTHATAVLHEDDYILLFNSVFEFIPPIRLDTKDLSLGLTQIGHLYKHLYVDQESATMYSLANNSESRLALYQVEASTLNYASYKWVSKKFVLPDNVSNFSAARINFTPTAVGDPPEMSAYIYRNNSVNSLTLNSCIVAGPINLQKQFDSEAQTSEVRFNYYVDGDLKYTTGRTDTKPFRLPAGFVGREMEIELSGISHVHEVSLATSIGELST